MRISLLFVMIVTYTCRLNAQSIFERGYFIDTTNHKIDCLIKNVGWKNNPSDFEYKLDENGTVRSEIKNQLKNLGYIISQSTSCLMLN